MTDDTTLHKKYQLAEWLKNEITNDHQINLDAFCRRGKELGLSDQEIKAVQMEFSEVMASIYFGHDVNFETLAKKAYDEMRTFYGSIIKCFTYDELSNMITSRIGRQA